jgi:hypothetical protein
MKDSISSAHSTNSLQSLIPHMPVPPRKCALLCSIVLRLPHFLSGLQQQAKHKVLEHFSYSLAPSGNQLPTILSLREFLMGQPTSLISHGPDNPLLQSSSQANQLHPHKMDMDIGSGRVMKIRRIAQWCVNAHG